MMKRILAVLLSLMMLMPCGLAEENFASENTEEATAAVEVVAEEMDEPSFPIEMLIRMLAAQLMEQDYTLDILTGYGLQTVRVGSRDGETIQAEVSGEGTRPTKILIDAEQVTVSDSGSEEVYTYGEILDLLLFGTETENIAEQVLSLSNVFDEHDLDFLETVGEMAYYELMNAGVIPVVKYVDDGIYFTMSLTPDLIETAAVRLAERLLEHEAEIDSLLVRAEPLLRELIPEMYEEYDPETGMRVEREAYTCAELRTIFESWRNDRWLGSWTEFEGMHLDVSGSLGDDGWRVDASFFMPGSETAVWFGLNGDEDGRFDGTLEYCFRGYSRASERYEDQSLRFNIDGTIMDNGVSIRVRPETPISGFTGLRIDCIEDPSGMVIDAVTDVLDIRVELSEELLNLSAVMEEFLLDVQLTNFGGIPQGSLICRSGRDGVYLKLNAPE